MTIEQAKALVELAEGTLLGQVRERLARDGALKVRSWLTPQVPPEHARALLDAAECQIRFSEKFHQSELWLLTREAAEQATRSSMAAWRASYLKERCPDVTHLRELGTGIGGDSVYLAREFVFQGYERDSARAHLATQNIRRLSPEAENAQVHAESASVSQLSGEMLFVDPARRNEGRKFHPEDWEPPLSTLTNLPHFRTVVVKAAPGLPSDSVPDGFEVHFLSHQGHLKEAMLLRTESLAPRRHAWLWRQQTPHPLHLEGEMLLAPVRPPKAGEFLLNPDPALVRSGLLGQFCLPLEAGLVHPKIAYISASKPNASPWVDSFRVLETAPLNWKRLEQAIGSLDWSDFEYLGRGVPFSQGEVLTKLKKGKKKLTGSQRGSLIIYRSDNDYQVLIAERIPEDPHPQGAE